MNTNKIAFTVLAFLAGGASGLPAFAASGAEVTNLSGTLSAQRPDGSLLILAPKSEVRPGDTLATQKDSYAQINFSDGSSMTMRPNSRMRIETYQFAPDKPQEDGAFFRLIKGGLRTVTGLVGKRGNQDAYRIGTVTATIGVRGSSGDTLVCDTATRCDGVVGGGDNMEVGTHHQTYTGSYIMQTGDRVEVIEEGFSAFSNGIDIQKFQGPLRGVNLAELAFFQGATKNFCRL